MVREIKILIVPVFKLASIKSEYFNPQLELQEVTNIKEWVFKAGNNYVYIFISSL